MKTIPVRRRVTVLFACSAAAILSGLTMIAASNWFAAPSALFLSTRAWPSLFQGVVPRSSAHFTADQGRTSRHLSHLDLRTCAAALDIPILEPNHGGSTTTSTTSTTTLAATGPAPASSPTASAANGAASALQQVVQAVGGIVPAGPASSVVSAARNAAGAATGSASALLSQLAPAQSPGSAGSTPTGLAAIVGPPASGEREASGTPAVGPNASRSGDFAAVLDMTGGTCLPVGLADMVDYGSSPVQADALTLAEDQLGTPYVWGGESKGKGFDCSGLVHWAFSSAGVQLPRGAQGQYDAGPNVTWGGTVVPGDLVFFGNSPSEVEHVGIVAGDGWMVDAPHTGAVVRFDRIAGFGNVVGVTSPGA